MSVPKPTATPVDADLAGAVLLQAAEVERLRGLIQVAVGVTGWDPSAGGDCPLCLELIVPDSNESRHEEGCPWPALVAEAAKP